MSPNHQVNLSFKVSHASVTVSAPSHEPPLSIASGVCRGRTGHARGSEGIRGLRCRCCPQDYEDPRCYQTPYRIQCTWKCSRTPAPGLGLCDPPRPALIDWSPAGTTGCGPQLSTTLINHTPEAQPLERTPTEVAHRHPTSEIPIGFRIN
jgi:hypothetical protein